MFTYIISDETKNYIKIGKTINIKNRFSGLQTGSPTKLTLEGWFEGDIEKLLHKEYKNDNHRNEWFTYSTLQKVCKKEGYIKNEISEIEKVNKTYTNVGLLYVDSVRGWGYVTALIERELKIGDIIKITDIEGYTKRKFFDEILECKIDNKYDNDELYVTDVYPWWWDTQINNIGSFEEIAPSMLEGALKVVKSKYEGPHEHISDHRKKYIKKIKKVTKTTIKDKENVKKKELYQNSLRYKKKMLQ